MIRVEDVHLSYRTGFFRTRHPVLQGLSFETNSDSIIGYLGINGAGKTTTIKLLVGINRPDRGQVEVAGANPRDPKARAQIGFLPENPYFYEYLTPREALDLYGQLHELERDARRKRADELLERVRLEDAADRPVRGFSKGMRQRLGLAQALIHDPKLLILDEPLTGLDPMGRLLLRDIIVGEREAGRTVFFSSHVLSDVEAICQEIVIIDGGKVHYSGSLAELASGFKSQRQRVLFSMPEGAEIPDLPWAVAPAARSRGHEGELSSDEAGRDAVAKLVEAGATILELRPLGLSLEDYFLERFHKPATAGQEASS